MFSPGVGLSPLDRHYKRQEAHAVKQNRKEGVRLFYFVSNTEYVVRTVPNIDSRIPPS